MAATQWFTVLMDSTEQVFPAHLSCLIALSYCKQCDECLLPHDAPSLRCGVIVTLCLTAVGPDAPGSNVMTVSLCMHLPSAQSTAFGICCADCRLHDLQLPCAHGLPNIRRRQVLCHLPATGHLQG